MKKVSCPECGQELSLRGLSGHLQFKHGYTAEDVKAAMIEAKEGAIVDEKDLSTNEVILQRIERMERKLGRMDKKVVQHDEGGEEGGLLEDVYDMVLGLVGGDSNEDEDGQTEEQICKSRCLELVKEIDELEQKITLVHDSDSIRKDFKNDLLTDLQNEHTELTGQFEALQKDHLVKSKVVKEIEAEEEGKKDSFFW